MRWFLLLLPLLFLACSPNDEDDEDACTPMPDDYFCISKSSDVNNFLKIQISTNKLNPEVPIAVYKGNSVEEGHLLFEDTISRSTFYEVPDGNYAARAYYTATVKGAISKVRSINDAKISAKKVEYCEDNCYEPTYEDLDLKLMSNLP